MATESSRVAEQPNAVLRYWNARAAIARHYYATRPSAPAPSGAPDMKVTRRGD